MNLKEKLIKKSGFVLSASAIISVGLLSACTTNGGGASKLALQSATPKVATSAKLASMATPLSYGYLTDTKMPVPNFKELEFNGKASNPAALAMNDAVQGHSSPVSLQKASPEIEKLISKYSIAYNVPERLVRRVVKRESDGNPVAKNGPYLGLMQITHPTAKGMGYAGEPGGLLDAETNLRYAVKYLAGAYKVAEGDETQAVRLYARGYYYDAKAKGMLEKTGLKDGPNSPETAFKRIDVTASKKNDASTGNGTLEVPAVKYRSSGA